MKHQSMCRKGSRSGRLTALLAAAALLLTVPACGGGGGGGHAGSTPSIQVSSTLLPQLASGQALPGDGHMLPIQGGCGGPYSVRLVGGALRKYLQAHDELPEQSLAAMAPVNVRSDKDKTGGNIVASMTVQVRSDVEDPLQRLQAVHESSSKAKELTNAIGAKTMTDYSQFIPATLTAQAARLASRWGLMNRMSPQFNCVITNVPGPPIPLYNTGAKMVANYGTGPVQDGLGLFHVISSYCGQFVISATSCRVIMPDPAFYRECLQASFDELLAAANAASSPAPAKKRKARTPARKTKARKARSAA